MEDYEIDFINESPADDSDYNDIEEDVLPELTPIQESKLEEIPDILDRIDELLRMLDIPKDLQYDDSHMKPFYTEDKIRDLYENIMEECNHTGMLNNLTSFDLLYFLHPTHNPPF